MQAMAWLLVGLFSLSGWSTNYQIVRKRVRQVGIDKNAEEVIRKRIYDTVINNWDDSLTIVLHENSTKIKEVQKVLNSFYCDGFTPLQYALSKKTVCKTVIEKLLLSGTKPNLGIMKPIERYEQNQGQFFKMWTSVHIAVRCGCNEEILHLLKQHKGNFFKPDEGGWRPIDLAFHYRIKNAAQFLNRNFKLTGMKLISDIDEKWVDNYINKIINKDLHYSHKLGFYFYQTSNLPSTIPNSTEDVVADNNRVCVESDDIGEDIGEEIINKIILTNGKKSEGSQRILKKGTNQQKNSKNTYQNQIASILFLVFLATADAYCSLTN